MNVFFFEQNKYLIASLEVFLLGRW